MAEQDQVAVAGTGESKAEKTKAPALTVVAHRRVKAEHRPEFEKELQGFVAFLSSFPGQDGIHVLRPAISERDYTIVARFADLATRRAFTASEGYAHWMERLGKFTDGDPRIEEMCGLETWATLPEMPNVAPPPRSKMAVLSFLGVFPTTALLAAVLGPVLSEWHWLLRHALIVGMAVVVLTWGVMPILARLLKSWLYPEVGTR